MRYQELRSIVLCPFALEGEVEARVGAREGDADGEDVLVSSDLSAIFLEDVPFVKRGLKKPLFGFGF